MAIRYSKEAYTWTIMHLAEHGDTDIFPPSFELSFLASEVDAVSDELAKLDITQHKPLSLIETIVPKSRYGFRVAHQIYPTDLVVFSTMVFDLAPKIENARDPVENRRVFSYRYSPQNDFALFHKKMKFRDWMENCLVRSFDSDKYSHVVKTDISDFYQRIYRHRLENIIENLTGEKPKATQIERFMKDWRSRQSFGIPVGNNACRILAECSLTDTDRAILSEGYEFSRYVDDLLIFVRKDQDAYAALAFLAGHLATNEGLSLNNQKTTILTFEEFSASAGQENAEDKESAYEAATERLYWSAYTAGEEDPEALEALLLLDLKKELEEEIQKDHWDTGKIRILLRALRLTKSQAASHFIRENLQNLVPFARDVVLLIDELIESGDNSFDGIEEELVNLLTSERLRPLEAARAWFLQLAVDGRIHFSHAQIRRLDILPGTLDSRQIQLIRSRIGDVNFFRQRKAKVDEINIWTQPTFIYAARCLPKDEYFNWLASIKSRLRFPLSSLYIDWCKETYN